MRIIDLDGPQGNAFALLGIAKQWSKDLELDYKTISNEMTSEIPRNAVQQIQTF